MKAVNPATKIAVDMFKSRCDELPFKEHPYSALLKTLRMLHADNWTDEVKEQAVEALGMWVASILAGSAGGTMNEIVALIRIANNGNDDAKKAANEMCSSMSFLEKIVTFFLNSVDIEHVADTLFEDGVRREKLEKEKSEPAPQEPEKKAEVKQIQNWTPTRWNPSVN
ncbi:MAG: hypothetical protein EBZ69_00685 [Alphaproteobacteria bacterium]|nr:hypothetical protein [Alphaproteobacteria bacterium]